MVKLFAGLVAIGGLIFLPGSEMPIDPLIFKLVILVAAPALGFCLALAQEKRISEPGSIRLAILMLLLVVLGFALIGLCEMGVECKISAYMSVVGLLLLALDRRIVDTKRSWWAFIVSNEPRTLVP